MVTKNGYLLIVQQLYARHPLLKPRKGSKILLESLYRCVISVFTMCPCRVQIRSLHNEENVFVVNEQEPNIKARVLNVRCIVLRHLSCKPGYPDVHLIKTVSQYNDTAF